MTLKLIRNGRETPSIATFMEIGDLYEATVVENKMDIGIREINEVAYPILSVVEIHSDSLVIEYMSFICHISSVFTPGNFTSGDISGLIHLLAVLVTYNVGKTENSDRKF